MRKIKVAMLAPYSPFQKHNGLTMHINKLTQHLSHREDIELHLITIGNKNMQFKKGDLNVHVIKKSLSYPFSIPSLLWSLNRKTIEIDPDMVHAEGSCFPYSTVVALVQNRYPTLLTVVGIVLKESKFCNGINFIFDMLLRKPNERYVVSKISHIIVDAPSIKDLISKWTESRIYVVPAGIKYDKIEEIQSHTSLNEKSDIFIASRLVRIKGIDILIKTIPKVINSIPNISVCIAGTGPQENELRLLTKRLNLKNHVKFLGFISEEEKYQYYKACKLVVVPSRWDCQPFTLFDAAASGKPVIASDMSNPGIVDDGKTGFIFKSENVEDLADQIILLLKDEELREEIGKAAKAKVKQYDWSKVAERYVEIYSEAIADFHERKAKSKKGRRIS